MSQSSEENHLSLLFTVPNKLQSELSSNNFEPIIPGKNKTLEAPTGSGVESAIEKVIV
jgi:hypothetical protein